MMRKGLTDSVTVEFVVDQNGSVVQARAIRSKYPEAAKAAVDAILQTQFTPGMKNGKAVIALMRLTLDFNLEDVDEQPKKAD